MKTINNKKQVLFYLKLLKYKYAYNAASYESHINVDIVLLIHTVLLNIAMPT